DRCLTLLSPPVIVVFPLYASRHHPHRHSFPTRRSSDLHRGQDAATGRLRLGLCFIVQQGLMGLVKIGNGLEADERQQHDGLQGRSEEHTSELQSRENLVCRLLLEKKKKQR